MTRSSGCSRRCCVAGCHGKYMRPVSDEPIAATPERLQRGSYLVNRSLFCGACHTAREHGNIADRARAHRRVPGRRQRLHRQGYRHVWDPNITPDPETGIGSWKDDEILRVLRDGVAQDGHFLLPLMPFARTSTCPTKTRARWSRTCGTVPPYRQERPRQENKLGVHAEADVQGDRRADAQAGRGRRPRPIAPTRSNTATTWCASRVRRLSFAGREGAAPRDRSAGVRGQRGAVRGPGARQGVRAQHLTGDVETGLGRYDAAAIKQALRNGHAPGRQEAGAADGDPDPAPVRA